MKRSWKDLLVWKFFECILKAAVCKMMHPSDFRVSVMERWVYILYVHICMNLNKIQWNTARSNANMYSPVFWKLANATGLIVPYLHFLGKDTTPIACNRMPIQISIIYPLSHMRMAILWSRQKWYFILARRNGDNIRVAWTLQPEVEYKLELSKLSMVIVGEDRIVQFNIYLPFYWMNLCRVMLSLVQAPHHALVV